MKNTLLIIFILLIFTSCFQDLKETVESISDVEAVEWSPTIAAPLIYSTLALDDVLDDGGNADFIQIEDDGSLTLSYTENYQSKRADEVIILPDFSEQNTIPLTPTQLSTLNSSGSVTFSVTPTINVGFDGNEIDQVIYKSGSLNINLSSTLEHDIMLNVVIPEATKNGISLSTELTALDNGNLLTEGSVSEDLSEFISDYTKTTNGHSEQEIQLELMITKKGTNTIKAIETISLEIEYTEQKYTELQGLFIGSDFSIRSLGSIDLGLFSKSFNGSFTVEDPKIKVKIENSVGVPIDARITQFDGENTEGNQLSLTGIPDPLPVAQLDFSDLGTSSLDSFELNNNTSNLAAYINNRPAKNSYAFAVQTTTSGSSRHWLLDSSHLSATILIEIPLNGTAKGFRLEEIQPFNFELDNTEEIKEVLIRLYTENGFPMDVSSQLYFEDSMTNTLLDSLFLGGAEVLKSGMIDASGRVVQPSPQTIDITLDEPKINRILGANRVRITGLFETLTDNDGSQPPVKFYEDYEIQVQLGVQATASITQ